MSDVSEHSIATRALKILHQFDFAVKTSLKNAVLMHIYSTTIRSARRVNLTSRQEIKDNLIDMFINCYRVKNV